MKKLVAGLAGVGAVMAFGLPVVAHAQAAAPEASPLTFNAGVASEYRYRGISQSRFQPALQGGADYAFSNGAYVGTWASTIKWVKDSGGKSDIELDVYGGYKGELAKDVTYDVGALQYVYPSHKLGVSPNTLELYGAVTTGPFTAKYSHSTTNLFGFSNSKNSGYLDLSATFDLGDGVMVTPHVGHQKVAGSTAGVSNSVFSYTDYSVSISKDYAGWVPSLTLLSTNATKGAYVAPNGKQLGRSGVVAAVKYNF